MISEPAATTTGLRWYFFFFFLSGFCSILYELIWLRLAMAQFGVTTALVSIVLSVFMAGLGLGSWGSGVLLRRYGPGLWFAPLRLYAVCELLIGCSALFVPPLLRYGRELLENAGTQLALSSSGYYLVAGAWLALVLLPWCVCIGATIPLAMFAIRRNHPEKSARSFSYLYLANVMGAVAGAVIPLLLIEALGFSRTLYAGLSLNMTVAAIAWILTLRSDFRQTPKLVAASRPNPLEPSPAASGGGRSDLLLLFFTGLTSMGMEVVWIRMLTPYLGTLVYAFATLLAAYLTATYAGSRLYRHYGRLPRWLGPEFWMLLGCSGLLPLLSADPSVRLWILARVGLGVMPFAGALGFVTPMLVDRWSRGDPEKAGSAYALNVLGCILGPLVAGFALLPALSERWSLVVLTLPWFVFSLLPLNARTLPRAWAGLGSQVWMHAAAALASLGLILATTDFVESFPQKVVRRDATATVTAVGEGMQKQLLVNGVGITGLSPITKMMAHLPLAFLDHPPQNALVICFGMGTTYRSLLSWGIPTTAVELVPSVPSLFSFYHPSGEELLHSPLSHVVIDDGRRYLERTQEQFDVITIDPPPPVQAAGSSLLYSREFYDLARRRLRSGGVLQQWLPVGDTAVRSSVTRALSESFPYVAVFPSLEGWGFHFLASMQPITPHPPAEKLVTRMPPPAVRDMLEWGPATNPEEQFRLLLDAELDPKSMLALNPAVPALQDDRPVNEYFLLRHLLGWPYGGGATSQLTHAGPSAATR